MNKIKIIVIFIIICLGFAFILYLTDKNYYLIVNKDLIMRNINGKYEKVTNLNGLNELKVKGYLENEYNTDLQFKLENNILKLYKNQKEVYYTNSLLYDKNIKVDNIDFNFTLLNSNDINYLNNVLKQNDINVDISNYEKFKYSIDLNNDGSQEELYFLSNNNILSLDNLNLLTDIALLKHNNQYTIINFNISENKVSSLYKVIDINKDKKYEFIVAYIGTSDLNNCYKMYSYDNKLKEIYSDC